MRSYSFPDYIQAILKAAINGDSGAWETYKLCRYNEKVTTARQIDVDAAYLDFFTEQLSAMTNLDQLPKFMLREAWNIYKRKDTLKKPENFITILKKHIYSKNVEIHTALQKLASNDNECMKALYALSMKRAQTGDRGAQYTLGYAYEHGLGINKDRKKAFQCYLQAVGVSSTSRFSHLEEAEIMLGSFYMRDDGVVRKDEKKAHEYFKRAAEKNHVVALRSLGAFYEAVSNMPRALDYYEQAAKQGDTRSQFKLGQYYKNAFGVAGVEKSLEKAFHYYHLSANQYYVPAQFALSLLYRKENNPKKSFEFCKQAADQGHIQASSNLGVAYRTGYGVEQDDDKAVFYYLNAARRGKIVTMSALIHHYKDNQAFQDALPELLSHYEAAEKKDSVAHQVILGLCYHKGPDFIKDLQKSFHYYQQAANQNDRTALCVLGYFYENGVFVEKNPTKAVDYYRKSAAEGYPDAYCQLGICYETDFGVEKDLNLAHANYLAAAKHGHARAQYKLGCLYESGITVGLPSSMRYLQSEGGSVEKAFDCYKKAANGGIPEAQMRLAAFYCTGTVVDEDLSIAVTWFKKAADKNHIPAHDALGVCYLMATGVKKDLEKALYHLNIAAKEGIATAQCNLAALYYTGGIGVEKNPEQAFFWYESAAKQYHPAALFMLGHCYEQGLGVVGNLSEAVQCYQKAKHLGYPQANAALLRCEQKMAYQGVLLPTRSPNNPTAIIQTSPTSVQRTSPTLLHSAQTIFLNNKHHYRFPTYPKGAKSHREISWGRLYIQTQRRRQSSKPDKILIDHLH